MPRSPSRRRLGRAVLAGLVAAGGAVTLGGCGFQLRRPPALTLKRIHLKGFQARSTLAEELRRQLRVSPDVEITEAAAQAEVVLEAITDRRERVAAAFSATGLISEMTLRSRFGFRVLTPEGQVLVPPTELLLTQDMSFSETAAMAKEHEANMLYRAMEQDIALQVLRRLAALPAR